MIGKLDELLAAFRPCFKRNAAFHWFVLVVFGFMVRLDHNGVTSFIRWLDLDPAVYESCLHFFRAWSWNLKVLQECWARILLANCRPVTVGGAYVLPGDGIKLSKEARKMPAVKSLHQQSENSGKAQYIYGHHFGVVGILVGVAQKLFCVPLAAEIHEGVGDIRALQSDDPSVRHSEQGFNLITRMIQLAGRVAGYLEGRVIVALDAYFSVGTSFASAEALVDSTGQRIVHIVTRAKRNVVAYEDPPPRTGRRGRPRKYGEKLQLMKVFELRADEFQQAAMTLYGKTKTVSFLCLDLIWKPVKDKLRFVLVSDEDERFILICSDLTLAPNDIIMVYSYRFKIEVLFKTAKHVLGVFCYHFWTSVWPKMDRRAGSSDLSRVTDKKHQRRIVLGMRAIERFVNLGCIAAGLMQILCVRYHQTIRRSSTRWLRTYSSEIPAEETVMTIIREEFYRNFNVFRATAIYAIIMAKARKLARASGKNGP
jgi:hypothetical protein